MLRMYENWVLRVVFGPEKDEVKGDWRRMKCSDFY
jgi:hypothetical protein